MVMCPVCVTDRIGKTEVKCNITDSFGNKLKKEMFVCLNCGVMFVEGELSPEQKKLRDDYIRLNPFGGGG